MATPEIGEEQETIAHLRGTPVGRRWLLKAGFSAAVAGTALELDVSRVTSAQEVVDLHTLFDRHQTAIALTICHQGVATVAPLAVAVTKSLLGQTPEITTLGNTISDMQPQGEDFAALEPAADPDGTPRS